MRPKEKPSAKLRVVPSAAQALSKEQRRFNKLLARVENLRRDRVTRVQQFERALAEYVRLIHPIQIEILHGRRGVLRALTRFYAEPRALGKRQREQLRGVMLAQYNALAVQQPGEDDHDLRKLYDQLLADENAAAGTPAGEDGDDPFPDKPDMSRFHPGMSREEIMAEIARQFTERMGHGNEEGDPAATRPEPKPRKPTATQLRKQQREAEIAEARKRSVSSIYKQLAKVLHPDLEPDPSRREEKIKLMQQLTAANASGDLHTLLRLELEFIHKAEGDLNHLGTEKLEIFSDLLQEQVRELYHELETVCYDPRFAPLMAFGSPSSVIFTDWRRMADDQKERLTEMKESLRLLESPEEALAELRAILKAYAEEQKRSARFAPFGF